MNLKYLPYRPRFTTNRAEGGYEIFLTKIPFKVPGVASLGFTSTQGLEFPDFLGFGGFVVRKWNKPTGSKMWSDHHFEHHRFLKVTVDTHAMACMVGRRP